MTRTAGGRKWTKRDNRLGGGRTNRRQAGIGRGLAATEHHQPAAERFGQEWDVPWPEHVGEYEATLKARGREPRYVAENCERLRRV